MPFDYNDCIKENLLRKIPPSKNKASRSIKKVREWLIESEKSLKAGASGSSILASYMTMFHAGRDPFYFLMVTGKRAMYVFQDILKKNMLKTKNWI